MKKVLSILGICICISLSAQHAKALTRVTVSDRPCQKITGFGAAALWHLMSPMGDPDIIDYLYGEDSPVGLNIMRMEIGPHLKPNNGAYNSWDKYVQVVIEAKSKGAIVLATPWSPPGEYKTNGYASGGQGSDEEGKLRTDCYDKFFTWLNSFLLYMSQKKAPVDIVSIQNEPDWWVDYSGCLYTPTEMHDLVANYAHILKKNLYKVKLMGSESLNHNPEYALKLLGDHESEQYIDIIGGHIYGNKPLNNMKKTADIASQYGKETWMTEHYIEGGDGTWNDEIKFAKEVNETMLAGGNAYVSWYMIGRGAFCGDGREMDLYPDNGWGKPYLSRCMSMAHFSKFITGSIRLSTSPDIPSNGADLEYSAYQKGDSIIVLAINDDTSSGTAKITLPYPIVNGKKIQSTEANLFVETDLSISLGQKSFNLVLPPKSITTFIYMKENESTGIEAIRVSQMTDTGYYTLDGKRHSVPLRGIYIHKGKKIIIK